MPAKDAAARFRFDDDAYVRLQCGKKQREVDVQKPVYEKANV